MSQAMFDKTSWNRAMGPALRVTGYFASALVVFIILYYILYMIASVAGLTSIITSIFSILAPITFFFVFVLSIFKVVDEELTGKI